MSGLTIGRFAELAGAQVVADTATAAALERPFIPSTDTRSLEPGATFVCLRGPNFDGHAFATEAAAKGAVAIVADVSAQLPARLDIPVLRVADAKAAYLCGAAEVRRAVRCTIIGVTGSVGKTTVKAMCAQLLQPHRRVLVTPQNENNELGVSKLCYTLTEAVDIAVIEMGARGPGQIAELVDIASPDIGVLTNIGESHLEFFENRASLARTKFALFGRGAKPVLSADDEWSRTLAAEHRIAGEALWVRLCGDPPVPGLSLEAGDAHDGRVPLSFGASHAFARWHLLGEHHLRDALLAAGGAILAGLTFEQACASIGDLALPPGRFEQHALPNRATIVYDAYNASPASMEQTLRAFAQLSAARHVAVLGSMAELGDAALAGHEQTGAAAARSGMDVLYCGGQFAKAMADGAIRAGMDAARVHLYTSNGQIAALLRDQLGEGDAILLKGSRVQRMEEILEALTAQGVHGS